MRYCTLQDIESYYLGKKFDCNGYVTAARVENFISQDAALINGLLRPLYNLPITDTEDLQILKMINEELVVGTIDDIYRERLADGSLERSRRSRKQALEWLKQIAEGAFVLGSELIQSDATLMFNNIDSEGNAVPYRFKNANIEPNSVYTDRERRETRRIS